MRKIFVLTAGNMAEQMRSLISGPDVTPYITLTRSRNISDASPSSVESNAILSVEAENATTIPMTEIRPGVSGGLLSMDSGTSVRPGFWP
ncbi:MAG: hypothetical protein WDM78_20105 [Puia sp.]